MDNITATLVSNDGINCNLSETNEIEANVIFPYIVEKNIEIEVRHAYVMYPFSEGNTQSVEVELFEDEELIGVKSATLIGGKTRSLGSPFGFLINEDEGKIQFIFPHAIDRYTRLDVFYIVKCYTGVIIIKKHPQDIIGSVDETITITVVVKGTNLSYQWEYSRNGFEWTDYPNATSNVFETYIRPTWDGLKFRCKVMSGGNYIYSNVATITIESRIVITQQPTDWTGTTMENCSFTVLAEGNGITYRWYYRNPNTTTWIRDGSTSASLSTYRFKMYANYIGMGVKCLITDTDGNTIWSDEATIYGYSGIKKFGETYYYFENAVNNTTYVGLCEYGNVLYYISNGTIDWNFNGTVEYQGINYKVTGGIATLQI